jgi:hypothetical protein
MKIQIAVLAIIISTASAWADRFAALTVTFTATASIQASPTTSGGTTTYPKPLKSKLSNKTLLPILAADEGVVFPSGAKLVLMRDLDDVSQSHFIVTDSKGNQLMDVSNLLTITIYDAEDVVSGKINNTTGLFTGLTQLGSVEIDFDDGGSNFLYFFGNFSDTVTDTLSKSGTTFSEKDSASIGDAQAQGELSGVSTFASGSFTFAGTNIFPF